MKRFLLPIFLLGSLTLQSQPAKEWLSLTPIKIEKPLFSSVKNVEDKTFSNSMLLDYNGINIQNFEPSENGLIKGFEELRWSKTQMEQDTLITGMEQKELTVNYFATYFSNDEFVKGAFKVQLFGRAEVYIDGVKRITSQDDKKSDHSIVGDWIPGKHSIIVKSISNGGKVISLDFEAEKDFENELVTFTISPKRGKNIYDILNGERVSRVDLSPSGKYAIVGINNISGGKSNTNTHIYRVADKRIIYSFLQSNVRDLQWIPGEDQVSYLLPDGEGMSMYKYDIQAQNQECLIEEDKKISHYTWAPDCSYLIYSDTEDYSHKSWELRKLDGIQDRHAHYRYRSFLCKYDFATGLHSRLTWGNLSTSLMDISSDGSKILFSTSYPQDNEYPFSKQSIYVMDVNSMELDTLWKDRSLGISCSFSPDNKKLLITGGPSAFGEIGENIGKKQIANQYDNQLFIYDIVTKKIEAITKFFDPTVAAATWHKNGYVYITANEADFVSLYKYRDGKFEKIEVNGDIVLNTSFSENGNNLIYSASESDYPARVYSLDLSNEESNLWMDPAKKQYNNIVFGELKDWDYQYNKKTLIDGRYYLPANFDPSKKYPLIVYYYGGTTPVERSFGGRWPFNLYAANGYVVYVMQPSGAIGYGQEFSARHQNNWAKITGDEIIASTKAFVKSHSFIDANSIGCMGASYGGFTTEYLTTQTDIFACAISHAGISDITSYWGEGNWGYQYSTNATAHSYPWNRKDIYVDQSPLFSADMVKVPIMLIHGTHDVNVPVGESIQFYTALKILGKDAELVFVNGADHTVVDYKQRIIWNNTILSYFAKYLKGKPAWWEYQFKDLNL